MPKRKPFYLILVLLLCVCVVQNADARRRRHRKKRYTGPPPTHPVVLWARTLEQSSDREQRKIAAFKLSQYSQNIYQEEVVNTLVKCMKDQDVQIKVLCTKAMGRAGTQSQTAYIRKLLLDQYRADPTLRNTIVRTFITRSDNTAIVHDTFLDSARNSHDQEELLVLMGYFEIYGSGSDKFVETLADIYRKNESIKLKRAVVKSLGDRAQGQDAVVAILSQCADSKDTPLALTCLAGMQLQAKKDSRAWSAVEKTIESSDPDVLMATLDVINALPEASNAKISSRLVAMVEELDDSELQEKAVLALGACGDHSEAVVKVLVKLLEDKDTDEAVRIASALMLGKQAAAFPDQPRESLAKCGAQGNSQGLRTACQLGQQELNTRAKALAAKAPAVSPSPAPKLNAQITPAPSPRAPNELDTGAARSQASTASSKTADPSPAATSSDSGNATTDEKSDGGKDEGEKED